MLKQYALVDDDGNIIDYVVISHKEKTENHIEPNCDKRLFRPKWDFDKKEWVEGLEPEVVGELEQEINRQKSRLGAENMNALAILELAMEIEKLKGDK